MLNLLLGTFYTIIILIVPVSIIGWISNIIQVIGIDNISDSTLGIVKLIGIFVPPLGAVLGVVGWF